VLFKHYSLQSFFFINTTYDRTDYGVFIMHIFMPNFKSGPFTFNYNYRLKCSSDSRLARNLETPFFSASQQQRITVITMLQT
jgi:hypothetical protein